MTLGLHDAMAPARATAIRQRSGMGDCVLSEGTTAASPELAPTAAAAAAVAASIHADDDPTVTPE